MEKKPKRSIEQLHHFVCSFCAQWWSIGDAPSERTEFFCPWCGKVNDYEEDLPS